MLTAPLVTPGTSAIAERPATGNHQELKGHQQQQECLPRYTHKMSGFKTSGFKTSETSGLQYVRFTKCQVYKTSGLQNVQLQKKHPYIFCTCGWWKSAGSVAAIFAGKVMAVFYSLF
jgi:hypothetical protein